MVKQNWWFRVYNPRNQALCDELIFEDLEDNDAYQKAEEYAKRFYPGLEWSLSHDH